MDRLVPLPNFSRARKSSVASSPPDRNRTAGACEPFFRSRLLSQHRSYPENGLNRKRIGRSKNSASLLFDIKM